MRQRAARSILVIYIVLVTGLQPVWSAPMLTSTVTDLGAGLFAYDLAIDGQDGAYTLYFAQDFTFSGNFAPFSRYHDEEDVTASYLSSPWADNTLGKPVQSPGSYKFHAGTGGGSKYLSLPLAHVVVAGELTISGTLFNLGNMYSFNGTFSTGSPFSALNAVYSESYQTVVDPAPEIVPPVTPEVPPAPEEPITPATTPEIIPPPVPEPDTTEIPTEDPPAVPEIPPAFPEGDNGIRIMPILDNPTNFPVFIWQPHLLIPAPTTIETGIFFDGQHDLLKLDVTLQPIVMFGDAVRRDMSFAITNAGITPNLAVPEPSTWSLTAAALATLALLGLSGRRRSTAA